MVNPTLKYKINLLKTNLMLNEAFEDEKNIEQYRN